MRDAIIVVIVLVIVVIVMCVTRCMHCPAMLCEWTSLICRCSGRIPLHQQSLQRGGGDPVDQVLQHGKVARRAQQRTGINVNVVVVWRCVARVVLAVVWRGSGVKFGGRRWQSGFTVRQHGRRRVRITRPSTVTSSPPRAHLHPTNQFFAFPPALDFTHTPHKR